MKLIKVKCKDAQIASSAGEYKNFTGKIDWKDTRGEVENATFELRDSFTPPIVWKNGVWKNGVWNFGTWKNGTFRGGVWKDGTWENGTWRGGVWYFGTWKLGIWKHGLWENGFDSRGKIHHESPNEW